VERESYGFKDMKRINNTDMAMVKKMGNKSKYGWENSHVIF